MPKKKITIHGGLVQAGQPEVAGLTIKEFCERYRIHRSTYYTQKKAKRITPRKVGSKVLIPLEEADRWFKALPVDGAMTSGHEAGNE